MEQERISCRVLVGKPEGERLCRILLLRWEDVDWIHLVQKG